MDKEYVGKNINRTAYILRAEFKKKLPSAKEFLEAMDINVSPEIHVYMEQYALYCFTQYIAEFVSDNPEKTKEILEDGL